MPERLPHIPDSELEQLLTDTGRWIAYPATPDLARAFAAQPAATTNGLAPTEDREVWRPPTGRFGIHSASAASMDDRPRSRKSQALHLAGAAAAFAIVGLILVLLFRELDDGGQVGGVPTSPPTEPLLIAVSSEGPVTAIDPDTGEVRYILDGGYQPDAIFSPDGTRLYVAGDGLSAHDASTGAEIWRVEYQYRLHWTIDTSAPSTLAVSPDGSRLYIASYDQERGMSPDANTIPHFIQTFDTANGENLGESEAIRGGCTVPIHPSPDGQRLYAPCDARHLVYELPSGVLQPPPAGLAAFASAASAQYGKRLYLITQEDDLAVVDMATGTVIEQRSLLVGGLIVHDQAAVSDDGARLFLGVSNRSRPWQADEVLVFDTETWQQIARYIPEQPISNRNLVVDARWGVYGASTSFAEGTSSPVSSTIWRADSASSVFEPFASLAAQEVAHVLLGYVPVVERGAAVPPATVIAPPTFTESPPASPTVVEEPTPYLTRTPIATSTPLPTPTASSTPSPAPTQLLSPTPTIDTSAAAIDAALAALPAESKGCQVTPGTDGEAFGWEVEGVTLIGEGELWMSFVGNGKDYLIPPLRAGRSTSMYWNIGGADPDNPAFVELTATELGAGTQIGPDGPQNAGEPPFFEGVMWKSYFTFLHAGCWQVIAERAGYAGVLWLTVEDAP